jgi:hypothetical protein
MTLRFDPHRPRAKREHLPEALKPLCRKLATLHALSPRDVIVAERFVDRLLFHVTPRKGRNGTRT